jgi:hypothetical protein
VIDDAITVPEPEQWSSGARIVNIVRMQYRRLFSLISGIDPFSPGHAGDGLRFVDVSHEFRHQPSVDANGEQAWSAEPDTLHSIGFGPTISSIVSIEDEPGFVAAEKAASVLIPRYGWGAPLVAAPVFRCKTRLLQAGDFVRVDLSWLPDYFKLRRHLQNYGQVIAIRDIDCSMRFPTIEISELPTLAAAGIAVSGFAATGGTIVQGADQWTAGAGFGVSGGTIDDQQVAGGTAGAGFAGRGLVLVAGGTAIAGFAATGGTFGDPPEAEDVGMPFGVPTFGQQLFGA